jgi:SAM-dependent methyltransferase
MMHHAVFKCRLDVWQSIEEKHSKILNQNVGPGTRILDVGCGWGRLLDLLPDRWRASYNRQYYGVDLSPDFISMGEVMYGSNPDYNTENRDQIHFYCGDVRDVIQGWFPPNPRFDLGVMISIRPMIIREIGEDTWAEIQTVLLGCCDRLLFLEYDTTDDGELMSVTKNRETGEEETITWQAYKSG